MRATIALCSLVLTTLVVVLLLLVIVTALHELEAFSVLHSRLILNRLLVFLVVESYVVRVEVEDLSELVGHTSPYLLVPAVFEPNLDKSLLCPQRQTDADDLRFLKLLT